MVLLNDTAWMCARRRRCPRPPARQADSARGLQDGLRHLSHRVLAIQDAQRSRLGRILQDKVCQLLIGINLHLLQLRLAVRGRTMRFDADLAATRRQAARSTSSTRLQINRRTRLP
jgi:signal transduction histidine kinase